MMFKKCLYILTVLAAMFCSTCWSANDPVDFSWSGEWDVQAGRMEVAGLNPESGVSGSGCDTELDVYDYKTGNTLSRVISKRDGDIIVTVDFESGGGSAKCGVFANGDPWISPADNQDSVTITGVTVTGAGQDGVFSDENPVITGMGLLPNRNGRDYGMYDASQTLEFPITYNYDTSIVSAIRSNTGCGTGSTEGNCVAAYLFTTVLGEVPPTFGKRLLRPPATGSEKPLINIDTDMDVSIWPSRPDLTGADALGMAAIANRWAYTTEIMSMGGPNGEGYSEGGRAYRPENIIDDYSGQRAIYLNDDIFTLFSDDQDLSDPGKFKAFAALLTNSMDTFFSVHSCTTLLCSLVNTWKSGAGQWLGRGPQSALWATMVLDPKYSNAMKAVPGYAGLNEGAYQEIEQLNIGPNGIVWGDGPDDLLSNRQETVFRYWSDHKGSPCRAGQDSECPESASDISGQRNKADPHRQIDGPPEYPGALYGAVIAGPLRALAVQMEMFPEFKETINYGNHIQEYTTRVYYVGALAAPDSCAPIDPLEVAECNIFKSLSTGNNCARFSLFGNTGIATYGPHPLDPTLKACIPNSTTCTTDTPSDMSSYVCLAAQPGDSNFGQSGRFPALHGSPINARNQSAQAEALFQSIFPNTFN